MVGIPVVTLCSAAAEEEAHRERHRRRGVPGREHTLRARHDRLQLPARLRGCASGQRLL